MIDITKPLTDYVIYEGKKIKLNISFDTVLKVYDIFKDGFLLDYEKAHFALALLLKGRRMPDLKLLDVIFKEQIETFQRSSNKTSLRVVDFKQYSAYIYSSFLMDYGIDLVKERGRLHWCAFIALFNGLSDDTPIRRIMRIRTEEMPAPTRSNAKQLQTLTELKTLYALPDSGGEHEDNWGGLFDMLLGQAEKGGG